MTVSVTNIGGTSQNSFSASTLALTVGGSGVPSGALIVIAVYECGNTSSTVGSVTDSAGNTYTKITDLSPNGSTINGRTGLFYAKNVSALSNVNTITYNRANTGPQSVLLSAIYATGVDTISPLDVGVTATSSGNSSSPSVTSGTPTNSGELFVGCTFWGGSATYTQDATHSWADPFANNVGSTFFGLHGGNQVNSGVGTKIYNPTFSFSSVYSQIVVGFKPEGLAVGAASGTGSAAGVGKSTSASTASAAATSATAYISTGIRNSVAAAAAVATSNVIGTTTSGTGAALGIGSASGIGRSTAASTAAAAAVASSAEVGTTVRNSVGAASAVAASAYVGTTVKNSVGSAAASSVGTFQGRSTSAGVASASGSSAIASIGVGISDGADNPTFQGVVDGRSANEYMQVDGGDYFNEVSAASWYANWHKAGAKFSLACIVYYNGGTLNIISNMATIHETGIQLLINSSGNLILRRSIGNHASFEDYVLTTGLSTGWKFIGVVYDEAGGAAASHWRVGTATGTFNGAASLITTSPPTYVLRLLGLPDGSGNAPLGSRILTMNAWARKLTATELGQFYNALKALRIGTI